MEREQNKKERDKKEQSKGERNIKEGNIKEISGNLNEKVLSMYRAVWEMIDEGQDIHDMKVADITSRAGIGKGTAYEYFRSKEEIVTKAMRYDFLMKFEILEKQIRKTGSFAEAIEICFGWLAENGEHRRFAQQFTKKAGGISLQESWKSEYSCSDEEGGCVFDRARQVLLELVQIGRKDGSIREGISDYNAGLQILSQFLGFFVHLEFGVPQKEKIYRTKQFLYDNMIKSLS
ncbi:MAG: TetR/AcrR family transcriptional regulator [Eubacteriales bacterium]|nr:TetR/AcrR family transcriptional regulator [Eubacteriales bacterium]